MVELIPKKKKRKSSSADEREKQTPLLQEKRSSSTSDQSKDKKLKKSKEKLTGTKHEKTKSKKKTKFVNPVQEKSTDTRSESNGDRNGKDTRSFSERFMEELAKDTSTDSSITDGLVIDTSHESTFDDFNGDGNKLDAHLDEPGDQSKVEATMKTCVKESNGKNFSSFKRKKKSLKVKSSKDNCAGEDSGEVKGSVVKPKKFELAFAFSKKNKPTNEKKTKKIQKKSSKISGKENEAECQRDCLSTEEMSVEGSSVKPNNPEQKHSKKNSKSKKEKQTVSKFKTPVKTSSKVTPATKVSRVDKNKKPSEKSKKTLEEILEIPSSDDPRKNPENYVSIDSLEKDMRNLYEELSQEAAATNHLTDDDLTEASDCVTMEFLDQQISGNTGNSEIFMGRITDSPEF
ncbi:pre-mRNA-splicing factor CWC22 homolog [Dendronephthya gigantea]|uniref:pre-mRNA-splicing factor CWC22 homolog n=1 Tax=Dendronephthya gigantea TaxID=151771 RepID=UPI001069CED1|nr:pre-mRNA-splicing factor CWC22 homolog [Dendronephthya gigantea]